MSTAPKLESRTEFFNRLRTHYHSLNSQDRDEAIDLLGAMNDPDAARELIQLYNDCQWRSTKLKIIKALSQAPLQRTLEFLFQLAKDTQDIPIAETAIWSLSQSRHPLASRFLTQLYLKGPPILKPAAVGALGQIPDTTLTSEFLRELPQAIASDNAVLTKNLVLTLGELKCRGALSNLIEIIERDFDHQISLSALISLGKIARDPKIIVPFENKFRANLFEHQLFLSVRHQVQLRSQWKLDDYFHKIFQSGTINRALPLELNNFDPLEVKEGLKAFADQQHREVLLETLGKLSFEGVESWFLELADPVDWPTDQISMFLKNLSQHFSSQTLDVLNRCKNISLAKTELPLFEHWHEAVSLCLPDAQNIFKNMFSSDKYRGLSESRRITILNHFINFILTIQCDEPKMEEAGETLSSLLENENSSAVSGRILRACAVLRVKSPEVFNFVKSKSHLPGLSRSCIAYLEACPSPQSAEFLLELLKDDKIRNGLGPTILKALSTQQKIPTSRILEDFIKTNLAKNSPLDARYEALMFLSRHPHHAFLGDILNCLKSHDQLRLAAVIALKIYKEESTAEPLSPLLRDNNESIVGRTLDTLTGLPGARARRLAIDYLVEHPEDLGVVDKISRCLAAPEEPEPGLAEKVKGIIDRYPDHPQFDDLVILKEKMEGLSRLGIARDLLNQAQEVSQLDQILVKKVKNYEGYDESIKSVLRSAELPFLKPDLFNESVDKSLAVLGYCKAVDMVLERELGKKLLIPKIESSLHEFQNVIHRLGLHEEFPVAERVLRNLDLGNHFTTQTLPMNKMVGIGRDILSGRATLDLFKTFDSLKAWAVVCLLFSRTLRSPFSSSVTKPLVPLKLDSDDQIVSLAKKMLALQEARSPVSKRQTLIKFLAVEEIRKEALELLDLIHRMF